jgi:hypothetical protein
MEAVQVAHHMETIIRRLAEEGAKAETLIADLARTTADYKRERAIAAIRMKGDGMAVTLIKHQAEGEVADIEANMIIAVHSLKAHFAKRDDLRSQLNGYQSINRHLSST